MTPLEIADLAPFDVIARLSERDIIALTLFGEARGEGPDGRIAVANVLRNRVKAGEFGGPSYRGVCLKAAQFSCWNASDPNFDILADTGRLLLLDQAHGPVLRECQWIADGLLANRFVDNTHGATHYLTEHLYATTPPSWAAKGRVLARIGAHVFLRVA